MTTLADLVAEVEDFMYSHGADRDKETTLVGSLTNSATTFTVAEASLVDRGLVEIDYELIAVKSKDNTSNVVTAQPWGRGQRGTTAASHSANARVAINPRFPRSRIKTEINRAISNLYPDLFKVATDATLTVNASKTTYALPAAVERVLDVQVDTVGPTGAWVRPNRWNFNYNANTTDYPNGKSLDIIGGFTPGRTINVTYATTFGTLSADADTLAAAGVDDSWADLITLQVVSKLVLALDPSRLTLGSVEQQTRGNEYQVGTPAQLSRQYQNLYNQRLLQEKALLQDKYKARQRMGV